VVRETNRECVAQGFTEYPRSTFMRRTYSPVEYDERQAESLVKLLFPLEHHGGRRADDDAAIAAEKKLPHDCRPASMVCEADSRLR